MLATLASTRSPANGRNQNDEGRTDRLGVSGAFYELRKQVVVAAVQGLLQSVYRCGQNVQLSRLDFLDSARCQIGQLCQFLLRQPYRTSLPADVFPDGFQPSALRG